MQMTMLRPALKEVTSLFSETRLFMVI